MTWFLSLLDLAAGAYLLGWALRREKRDKDAVLAVGILLLFCAVLLAALALSAPNEPSEPSPRPVVTDGVEQGGYLQAVPGGGRVGAWKPAQLRVFPTKGGWA